MSEECDYTVIDSLIERLETSQQVDHMALWAQARPERLTKIGQILDQGLTWGEAMGAHPILNQSEVSFRAELQSIKQNLAAHIDIFCHDLDGYFRTGDHPPPHYPMRIAIILRKQGQSDRERRFLSAYFKHFATKRGSRTDEKLVERATKLGVFTALN